MRIGIFGGTFDPPHLGHLILAAEAVDQAHLDKLLWVLTPDPPHKQGAIISTVEHRLAMVQAMVKRDSHFELSDIEMRRPGPHFALDTMIALHRDYPEDELLYVIGGDSLRDLPSWHKPAELIEVCDGIIVLQRPGAIADTTTIYQNYPGLKDKLSFLDAPEVEISAANIRQRAKQGHAYWHYVIPEVARYIEEKGLYL
jgi:nicotinate-nucleotide adenylyltransferase